MTDIAKELEKYGLKSAQEREVAEKAVLALAPLTQRQRKKALSELRKQLGIARVETDKAIADFENSKRELEVIKSHKEALSSVFDWADAGDLSLSQPHGSAWYKLKDARNADRIVTITSDTTDHGTFLDGNAPTIFVVEHDWAAAFSGSDEFESGDFRLPDRKCGFEFQMGRRRVIAIAFENEHLRPIIRPYIQAGEYWVGGLVYEYDGSSWLGPSGAVCETSEWLIFEIARQLRAISIVLETSAIQASNVPAPDRLNVSRAKKGQPPLNGYVVLKINPERVKRHAATSPDREPSWKVRCHFRRGHWRHYENHKKWIKWMLVGDPDLGFVNKHYRV